MATGDLRNNISKLESSLKTIKYPALLDSFGVSRGDPVAFLPLLHYVLLNYSPLLTKHFNSKGLDFFGKKDARFIETLYSALLDEFNYKPKISKEQFFAKGYAEQKCIFVNDVIRFLKELKASITRKNRVSTSGKNNLNPLIFNSNHTAAEPSIIRAKDYDQFQQDRIKNEIVLKELPTTETENISTKPSPFPPSKHSTNNFWAGNSWNNPNLPQIPIPQQYPIESYDQHTIDDSLLFYQAGQSFNQQYIQEDELNYSYNDSYIIANSSGLHQDIDNHGSSIDVEEKSSKPLQGLYENSHKPLLRKLDSELTSSTLDTIPNSDNFAKQVERNPESAINAHSTEPQQSNHNANSYITNSLISDERVIELERLLNESKSQQLELVQTLNSVQLRVGELESLVKSLQSMMVTDLSRKASKSMPSPPQDDDIINTQVVLRNPSPNIPTLTTNDIPLSKSEHSEEPKQKNAREQIKAIQDRLKLAKRLLNSPH